MNLQAAQYKYTSIVDKQGYFYNFLKAQTDQKTMTKSRFYRIFNIQNPFILNKNN